MSVYADWDHMVAVLLLHGVTLHRANFQASRMDTYVLVRDDCVFMRTRPGWAMGESDYEFSESNRLSDNQMESIEEDWTYADRHEVREAYKCILTKP